MKKSALPLSAWLLIAAVVVLAGGFLFWSIANDSFKSTASAETSAVDEETDETADEASDQGILCKSGEFKGMVVYPSGTYEVGMDIPAGEYLVILDLTKIEAEDVNVSVFSASDCSISSMIADFTFPNRGYLVLKEGQYCSIANGLAAPVEETDAYISEDGTYPENCYLVGRDLAAGDFILDGTEGSYALYRGGILQSQLKASGTVNGKIYLNLQEGDYLEFTGATGYDPTVCEPEKPQELPQNGMLLVGDDLETGSYTVTAASEHASLVIQQGAQGSDGARDYERISLAAAEESTSVVLEEGDYLVLNKVILKMNL